MDLVPGTSKTIRVGFSENADDVAHQLAEILVVDTVIGATGFEAVKSLAVLMLAFYITCFLFVFGVLGLIARLLDVLVSFARGGLDV